MAALAGVAVMVVACNDNDPLSDSLSDSATWNGTANIALQRNQIQPDSIVIELYGGHSHLPQGTEPEIGSVYWSNRNGGFHANPPSVAFPMRTYQKMVYRRTPKGDYVADNHFDTVFRMQSSPQKTGNWYGLVVKLYDKNGSRMDIAYKSPEQRNNIQVFYQVSDLKPIAQTITANVVTTDTTFTANDMDVDDSDEQAMKAQMLAQGFNGTLTLGYQPVAHWTADSAANRSCYFWYFDRPEDDTKELLTTPVGFRGVLAARIPFVAYNLVMRVCGNKGGATVRTSDNPSEEQLQNVLFNLKIPFRNVFETPGWGKPTGNEGLLNIVWDKEYNYLPAAADRVINNRCMFIPVLREYPSFTVEQLRRWYETDSELSFESANFWL